MTITIPAYVRRILDILDEGQYEAYVVGGCVRDSLLGRVPDDWDVTTSALPEETRRLFSQAGFRLFETGLKHGTLTVLSEDKPVEITTFRVDGGYSDNRHPDEVRFTHSLAEDLCRRDFTINAMAYHPDKGLQDLYSGRTDLQQGILRCVGVPDVRFHEDALRILRALRFSAVLGFSLEEQTEAALRRSRELLKQIAAERLCSELLRLLCGKDVLRVLLSYPEVLAEVIPELAAMVGFQQHNAYHAYDVYEHTARCVAAAPAQPVVRLTVLLHDIGKPSCFTQDAEGVGHFYGHQAAGAAMVRTILTRLRLPTRTVEAVERLVTYHDIQIEPRENVIRRWLNRLGEEEFRWLLEVKKADICGQNPALRSRVAEIDRLSRLTDKIVAEGQCFSLKDLQVNGHDLMALGLYPGKKLGDLLQALLEQVLEGRCPNEREALLAQARALLQKGV